MKKMIKYYLVILALAFGNGVIYAQCTKEVPLCDDYNPDAPICFEYIGSGLGDYALDPSGLCMWSEKALDDDTLSFDYRKTLPLSGDTYVLVTLVLGYGCLLYFWQRKKYKVA